MHPSVTGNFTRGAAVNASHDDNVGAEQLDGQSTFNYILGIVLCLISPFSSEWN